MVSDGRLVLTLTPADEGGYVVTSPLEPEMITEAETLAEAFDMARDAVRALHASRAKLLRKLAVAQGASIVVNSSATSEGMAASCIIAGAGTTSG